MKNRYPGPALHYLLQGSKPPSSTVGEAVAGDMVDVVDTKQHVASAAAGERSEAMPAGPTRFETPFLLFPSQVQCGDITYLTTWQMHVLFLWQWNNTPTAAAVGAQEQPNAPFPERRRGRE